MSEACPNCGQPVLPADTVCWHCGYALPRRPKARGDAHPAPGRARRPARAGPADEIEAAESADYDLRALAVYGLLTLAVVLGLWLVMRALGRQPVLVRSASVAGGDWVTVTDTELRYTLNLPAEWQWLDVSFRDQSELLAEIIDRHPYIGQALDPLGQVVGDVELMAAALGAQDLAASATMPFAVIGRSARLGQLEPQGALDLLAQQTASVSGTTIDTHLSGQPQARFVAGQPDGFVCHHLFVNDEATGAYLVAVCAPRVGGGAAESLMTDVLDSFQLLERRSGL